MHNDLINILGCAGMPLEQILNPDGSRLLLLPYGARVLGLFAPGNDDNFFWTHPTLSSANSAQKFFQASDWHNSGGDRTWLAPEVDLFFPNFPDTKVWHVPAEIDPGKYARVQTEPAIELASPFTVRLSRHRKQVEGKIVKSWGPAPNPLRYDPVWRGLVGVVYAGYTQHTWLEYDSTSAQMGLWNVLALPHGGEVLIPTHTKANPKIYASPIDHADLVVKEHLVRFRTRSAGIQKIGIDAVSCTGRIGHISERGRDWQLVVRNFALNPSGEYIDVPWAEQVSSSGYVYSTQACSVHTDQSAYCELEYHAPGIGVDTGFAESYDTSQVWAFRGSESAIRSIGRRLLSSEIEDLVPGGERSH